jgi:guanylate kinase
VLPRVSIVTNLFLIDGVSGTGKSDLIEYVQSTHHHCGVLIKATTRELRPHEKIENVSLDLKFLSTQEFDSHGFDYVYEYYGNHYGFFAVDLNTSLKEYSNVFAIIRNIELISKLKETYKPFNVVAVFIHSDLRLIAKRLRLQGRSQSQIDFRLRRLRKVYGEYIQNSNVFNDIILNNSDKRDFHLLIDNLVLKYSNINKN